MLASKNLFLKSGKIMVDWGNGCIFTTGPSLVLHWCLVS